MGTRIAWHQSPRGEAYKSVFATSKSIRDQQRLQRFDLVSYLELYSAGNVAGIGRTLDDFSGYYQGKAPKNSNMRGARFNMSAAICDTAHSLIAANPPVPIYITSGVDLGTVRKADRKSKVLQAQMNDIGSTPSREAFHMATKTGTGIVYGYLEDGQPKLECVNPLELLVDHQDGFYRQPKSIHRVRYVHKEVLRDLFGAARSNAIDKAQVSYEDWTARFFMTGVKAVDEMVEVIESWHLGTGWIRHRDGERTQRPGRHTITISTCDLVDEPFTDSEFPFAVVRYRNRAFGFFGAGLIESTRENQNRVNQLIRRVAKAQDLCSTAIIFNPNGEGSIDPQWLSNEIGMIFNYEPNVGVPQLAKWDGTLGDLQQQIDLEFERVLRVEGLAESQVSGEGAGKGLTSGVAVRAQDDVMSRRLINPVTLFQSFCVDVARLLERLNDRAAEMDSEYEARGFVSDAGRTFLKSSRWKELQIEDGTACLNMMPMSIMPTTPAGKWAAIQEWIQAGFLDKTSSMKLLQFPAIDETASLETAQLDLVLYQLESVLDGVPTLPMERQDLGLVVKVGTMAWAKAQMMNPDNDVQDAFDAYLDYAQSLIQAATAPAPDAAADPMAAAGAAPAGAQVGPGPAQGGIAPTAMIAPMAA